MSIENELKELIINDLGMRHLTHEDLPNDVRLFGEGIGLDSLDAVELVVLLQKKYGINPELLEENREVLATIETLSSFVREHRKPEG